MLEKGQISFADPECGRFRTFLLRSLENFLHNEHARAKTQKRGGNREIISIDTETAEALILAKRPLLGLWIVFSSLPPLHLHF